MFDVGKRVEAYTGPLWVDLLTPTGWALDWLALSRPVVHIRCQTGNDPAIPSPGGGVDGEPFSEPRK